MYYPSHSLHNRSCIYTDFVSVFPINHKNKYTLTLDSIRYYILLCISFVASGLYKELGTKNKISRKLQDSKILFHIYFIVMFL